MPILTDTEWRLLCVLVRATCGWQTGPGRRKQRDWLTHSQLKTRTGRASEAVSRAIDQLIRKGLIEVSNDEGKVLLTAAERRRTRSRHYYRLTARAFGEAPRISENSDRKGENRKSKTTKETLTKRIPNGIVAQAPPGSSSKTSHSAPDTATLPSSHSTHARRFLKAYCELFRQHSAHGESPPISWAKDTRHIRPLLDLYGLERLLELLSMFFASPEPWIQRSGYSLGAFRAAIPQLLMRPGHNPVIRVNGWQKVSRS